MSLPVACNSLERAIIPSEWDVESNDSLTSLNKVEVLWVDAGLGGSVLIEHLNLLKETWLVVLVEFWSKFLLCCGESCTVDSIVNQTKRGIG